MMFKRIDHVEIVTDQLDRTVQFYTETLGFTVKARDRIESSSLGVPIDLVYLDLGGTVVELITYEGAPVDPRRAPRQSCRNEQRSFKRHRLGNCARSGGDQRQAVRHRLRKDLHLLGFA